MTEIQDSTRGLRILIAYYSRGGRTRSAAQALAEALGSQHEVQIRELQPRRPLNFLQALMLTRKRGAASIEPLTTTEPVDLVYLGAPVWGGQYHAMAWGYLAAGPVAAPHVVFSTSAGGDNESVGLRPLADALAARGCPVRAVVDMKYPEMLAERLPVLVEVARVEAGVGR